MDEDLYEDQESVQEEGPKVNGQRVFSVLCEKKKKHDINFLGYSSGIKHELG